MDQLFLVVAILICLYTAVDGNAQFSKFAKLTSSRKRIELYKIWIGQSWVMFGAFASLVLLLAGQTTHLLRPITTANVSKFLQPLQNDPGTTSGFFTGLLAGSTTLVVVVIIRARQGKSVPTIGNFSALLTKNRREQNYGIGLALTAAVTEELFFRAMLPVLLLSVFHSVPLALWTSLTLFAMEHYYQGWKGVVGTFLLGGILMQLFIFTGTILVPIAVHAFIDLNSLVAVPALARFARKAGT